MALVEKDKLDYILSLLKKLEYGSLVITIHAGHITQIDSTVKNRFGK
ncbi:YezD family protein [Bacillus sp. BRMEA1]|nr:YezD family protein [Neobacillus endophyticus]NRD79113.1 YezD family protein [Neobacillus endophyticus]